MRLYWVVAANLRDEILKSYDIHPTDLDDALEGAVLEMAAENRDGDANLEKTAAELARSMAREHPINGAMLIRTLRQGQVPLFEALFEEWCGVALPRRREVLYGGGGAGPPHSGVAPGVPN